MPSLSHTCEVVISGENKMRDRSSSEKISEDKIVLE